MTQMSSVPRFINTAMHTHTLTHMNIHTHIHTGYIKSADNHGHILLLKKADQIICIF